MPVLNTYKLEEVAINTEGAMPRTKSNMGPFFSTQGQVALKQVVQCGQNSNLRFYACPEHLQV